MIQIITSSIKALETQEEGWHHAISAREIGRGTRKEAKATANCEQNQRSSSIEVKCEKKHRLGMRAALLSCTPQT
jgi:hypothetical protein